MASHQSKLLMMIVSSPQVSYVQHFWSKAKELTGMEWNKSLSDLTFTDKPMATGSSSNHTPRYSNLIKVESTAEGKSSIRCMFLKHFGNEIAKSSNKPLHIICKGINQELVDANVPQMVEMSYSGVTKDFYLTSPFKEESPSFTHLVQILDNVFIFCIVLLIFIELFGNLS